MIKIKDLRMQLNMTQNEFAEKFDLPVRTLQRWEQHQNTPPCYIVSLIQKIIDLEAVVLEENKESKMRKTKKDLVGAVAEKTGATKVTVNKVVDAIFEEIACTLEAEDEVSIPGFGIFQITHRKARKGRNPQTNEEIEISASNGISFRAGKLLKERVNK